MAPTCDPLTTARRSGDGVPTPSDADLATLLPACECLGPIGRGGMGAVYRVRRRSDGRLFALKLMWAADGTRGAFTARFVREAEILARLQHPNIVAVHGHGQSGPWSWLLMDLIEGANLREVIATGRLSPAQALSLVPPLCSALQYAHDQGVVHRDLKPENILLDAAGAPHLVDFGLAKLRDSETSTLTNTGAAMGTVHYMAPEQVADAKSVDHRADIYALGVIIYEILTGELPLGRFEEPSQRVSVGPGVDAVVLKALERDPRRRWQRISQIGEAVEREGPVQAPLPTRIRSAARGESGARRRVAAIIAWCVSGAGALLLAISVIVSRSTTPLPSQPADAEGSARPSPSAAVPQLTGGPPSLAASQPPVPAPAVGPVPASSQAGLVDVRSVTLFSLMLAEETSAPDTRFTLRRLAPCGPGGVAWSNDAFLAEMQLLSRNHLRDPKGAWWGPCHPCGLTGLPLATSERIAFGLEQSGAVGRQRFLLSGPLARLDEPWQIGGITESPDGTLRIDLVWHRRALAAEGAPFGRSRCVLDLPEAGILRIPLLSITSYAPGDAGQRRMVAAGRMQDDVLVMDARSGTPEPTPATHALPIVLRSTLGDGSRPASALAPPRMGISSVGYDPEDGVDIWLRLPDIGQDGHVWIDDIQLRDGSDETVIGISISSVAPPAPDPGRLFIPTLQLASVPLADTGRPARVVIDRVQFFARDSDGVHLRPIEKSTAGLTMQQQVPLPHSPAPAQF